ncbi:MULTISPECIES: hypothetical protein [Amycolatopsis]|uniref:Transmembrane protein n=1 Tax=Amycolatopsis albidoflavus TaxID=102226 RepID=A0ABW5HRS3_9PSEU
MRERGWGQLIAGALTVVSAIFIARKFQVKSKGKTSLGSSRSNESAASTSGDRVTPRVLLSENSNSDAVTGRVNAGFELFEQAAVGITFIDLLFAAVLARVLEIGNTAYAAGVSHLILSVTVIVTSWIGYRNSSNRARERLKFFNIAFFQFVIEICFLYIYWLLANTYEGRDSLLSPVVTSATPETAIMAVFFGFNCLWDQLALWRRRSKKYPACTLSEDLPRRRLPTMVGFLLYTAGFALVSMLDFNSLISVIVVDSILAVVAVTHRFLQGIPWVMKTRRELEDQKYYRSRMS